MVALMMSGCREGIRDEEIKADLTMKAKEDLNFAGVQFYVENAQVTLSGSCPTLKSRALLIQKIKAIHVVDTIINNLEIAPVVLTTTFGLKQDVDSILSKYPTVTALVTDSIVVIKGKVKDQERGKLLRSLGELSNQVRADQ
ncbi:BON domain-containing protein [Pedobacter sp. CFBP9032]|uniref:BON domain-containing protein n=1 Tax=Pedobacter sp. CFBP9032 TaxID=3096539 RepID=UPI002A698CB4|nr:BON domain-containing protein [Pedobacter sp. CFBP9032]